jgi:hypothetical protein
MMRLIKVFLFFLFLLNTALAAELRFDFWREYRTYNWNQSLRHISSFGDKFNFEFENSINSTLIKKSLFTMGQDRWQEDGEIAIKLNYNLTPKINVGSCFDHSLSSLENHKVNQSGYSLFSEWSIFPRLKLKETLGLKTIRRKWKDVSRPDQGLDHEFNLIYNPSILGDEGEVSFKQEDIRFKDIPSLQRELKLSYKKFSASEDSLDIYFHETYSSKNYYSGETYTHTSTQKRRERALRFGATRNVFWEFRFKLDYDFLLNKYRYSAEQDSLFALLTLQDNSFTTQSLLFNLQREFFERFSLESFYLYSESDENYWGVEKDQEMKSGEIGTRLSLKITSKDSLYLSGSIGVTSFYTPQTSLSFSDRDIMTKLAKLEHLHIFSPHLSLRTDLGFNNFHQIYLSERLSANNNYNETYILYPRLFIQPFHRLKIEQSYSIQANYISYDFEKETESSRNKILRRGSSSTRVFFIYSPRLDLDMGYTYRYEDYGQLLWQDQWVARRSWERRTHRINLGFSYQIGKKIFISPTYDYEIKKEWDHILGKRDLAHKFYRDMISLKVNYFTDSINYIQASFRYRFQKDTPGIKDEASSVNVSLAHQF